MNDSILIRVHIHPTEDWELLSSGRSVLSEQLRKNWVLLTTKTTLADSLLQLKAKRVYIQKWVLLQYRADLAWIKPLKRKALLNSIALHISYMTLTCYNRHVATTHRWNHSGLKLCDQSRSPSSRFPGHTPPNMDHLIWEYILGDFCCLFNVMEQFTTFLLMCHLWIEDILVHRYLPYTKLSIITKNQQSRIIQYLSQLSNQYWSQL